MKRIVIGVLLLAIACGTHAQRGSDSSGTKKPMLPARTNKTVVAQQQQQQTTQAVNPSLAPPKKVMQTATAQVAVLPTEGKDVKIQVDQIMDSSGATNTIYVVRYSIINTGTQDVDITRAGLQGTITQAGHSAIIPSGGTSIIAADLGNHPVLKPGEHFSGRMLAGTDMPLIGAGYTYRLALSVNGDVNAANNTIDVNLQGHKQPDLVPDNLHVTYNAGHWEISFRLNNAGTNPIDLAKVSMQGYFVEVVPTGPNAGGCGFNVTTQSTMLNPGQSYSGSFNCGQNNLHSGKDYNYQLIFTSYYPVPELSTTNNTASVKVTAP